MDRTFLTEDIEQIRRYFPGAKVVALRTPFDLTDKQHLGDADIFRDTDYEVLQHFYRRAAA